MNSKKIPTERVELAERIKNVCLLKLEQRKQKGDWKKETLHALMLAVKVESQEAEDEFDKIWNRKEDASFEKAKKEVADNMNYWMMIFERLEFMELDEIWKTKEKNG